jgi:hypothetical protein
MRSTRVILATMTILSGAAFGAPPGMAATP